MRPFIDEQMARLGYTSLTQFAAHLGVARETLSRWYNQGQLPTTATAQRVAARLGVELEDVPHLERRGVSLRVLMAERGGLESELEELAVRVERLAASLRELQAFLPPGEAPLPADGAPRRRRSA